MATASSSLVAVYLAGGMRGEWRERVKAAFDGVEWLDPTTHGLEDSKAYTEWDLNAIHEACIVFAYLEASNPVGYNMAFEVGYAQALGKLVIYVDEKHAGNPRPCSMLRETAWFAADSFSAGLAVLKTAIDVKRGCAA